MDPAQAPLQVDTVSGIIDLIKGGGSAATIVLVWLAFKAKATVDEIVNLFKTTMVSVNTSMRDVVHEIRNMRQELMQVSRDLEIMQATQGQPRSGRIAPRTAISRVPPLPEESEGHDNG